MALTKTVLDGTDIGTVADFSDYTAGAIDWASQTAYATGAARTTNLIDVTGKVGVAVVFRGKWTTTPTTRPKLEVFTAPENDLDTIDTEAYETVELPYGAATEKQITIPLRFSENVRYINCKVTNGTVADSTAKYYVAVVVTSL